MIAVSDESKTCACAGMLSSYRYVVFVTRGNAYVRCGCCKHVRGVIAYDGTCVHVLLDTLTYMYDALIGKFIRVPNQQWPT